MLAVAEVQKVYQIDSQTGDRTYLYAHKGEVYCLRFTYDGTRIISGGADEVIKIWDIKKQRATGEVSCKGIAVDLAVIPGSDKILVTIDAAAKPGNPNVITLTMKVVLVDLRTSTVQTVVDNATTMHNGLAVTLDGKRFAFPHGNRVEIGSIATLKIEDKIECPLDPNTCVFARSGGFLLVGGSRKDAPAVTAPAPGEVAIYDLNIKKWVSHFRVLDNDVNCMALSSNDELLAVSSTKLGTITLWDLSSVLADRAKPRNTKGRDAKD